MLRFKLALELKGLISSDAGLEVREILRSCRHKLLGLESSFCIPELDSSYYQGTWVEIGQELRVAQVVAGLCSVWVVEG